MKSVLRILTIVFAIAMMMFSAACGRTIAPEKQTQEVRSPQPVKGAKPVTLLVSAAASLADAMQEIKTAYAKESSNVTITYNFGSSGSLQQQIEQGAEVDIFISAAAKQMDILNDKGMVLDETRKNLLGNKLVLIHPEAAPAIDDFMDLATGKVKRVALGEPKSVPAGQYAEEVLTKLKLMDAIKPKAVYAKDVKEVLAWVETGNADAGIVYETDARASGKVKTAAMAPEGSHAPVIYPSAVLKGSKYRGDARAFINYLYSDKAKPVFEKYGFTFMPK